jgi:CheY-like chemotaxis protein
MRKILFVEDDEVVASIYSKKLLESGFDLIVAEDGLAAMKRLPEFRPDLVVLDLMLPKFTGLDVLKFVRQHPELKSTRVVVFSNAFLSKLGSEAVALGVEEVLAKAAMTPILLAQTIDRILNTASSNSSPASATSPRPVSRPAPSVESARPVESPEPAPAAPANDAGQSPRGESASGFRRRIRQDFFDQLPAICKGVEQTCTEFLDAINSPTRMLRLEALSRKIRFITHMTGMAGCFRIAQLSTALEALLFELQEKPASINESSRHTIRTTVALLAEWLAKADQSDEQVLSPTSILVVDDDAVSNRALVFALSRANITAKSLTDPVKALEKLRSTSYDLVLLDINMPVMSGISVCEQMRALPMHKNTPVIFITSYAEFEKAARSVLGAGDDFISKPIMPIELTVKVTAHVLKRRMAAQAASK